MTVSGAGARRKGHQWERDVAGMFREAMPGTPVFRGFQHRGGGEAADVENPFFHVECKVGKKHNPRAALAQAQRDNRGQKTPIAVIKDDQERPGVPANTFVVIGLLDFLEILEEWYKHVDV